VEKLRVRAANDPVQRGQVLAEIYSPDILAAQEGTCCCWARAATTRARTRCVPRRATA
jgi:Cu(I)/Ag(I) efflux system membrane fusion protein